MTAHINLSVCPHDTVKHAAEWFEFTAHLQHRLGRPVHFKPQDDFFLERQNVLGGGFHLVYANPISALTFRRELGFIPVAKPAGMYDEVVLVGRSGTEGIPEGRPLRVATASDEYLIHILGLALLERLGVRESDCAFVRGDSWMKAAHSLLRGEAELGFMFNDAWSGMGEGSRRALAAVAKSDDRVAFHCFCVAPEHGALEREIQAALLAMNDDSKGRPILDALGFAALEPIGPDALDALAPLLGRHRPGATQPD